MSLSLVTPPAIEPLVWAGQVEKQLRLDGQPDDQAFVTDYIIPATRERAEGATRRQFLTAWYALKLDAFPGVGGVFPGWGGFDDRWGWFIEIPKPPLQFATATITGTTHGTTTIDGIADTSALSVGMFVTTLAGTDFAAGTTIKTIGANSVTLNQAALSSATVAITAQTLQVSYIDTLGNPQTWDPSLYLVDAPTGPKCARGRISPAWGIPWPITQLRMNAITISFKAGYGDEASAVPALLVQGMLLDCGTLYENREDIVIEARVSASVELSSGCDAIYRAYRSYPAQRRR